MLYYVPISGNSKYVRLFLSELYKRNNLFCRKRPCYTHIPVFPIFVKFSVLIFNNSEK